MENLWKTKIDLNTGLSNNKKRRLNVNELQGKSQHGTTKGFDVD